MPASHTLERHYAPKDLSDRVAYGLTRFLRFFADTFFARRYGHRAVVLETIAAVPGMVGGALQHLRALRRMESDHGRIRTLLDEAENERMHLMTFIHIARPTWFERLLILIAQGVFYNLYFLVYLLSPRTAHRVVGYFEEEAVISYTEYERLLILIAQGVFYNRRGQRHLRQRRRAQHCHRLLETRSRRTVARRDHRGARGRGRPPRRQSPTGRRSRLTPAQAKGHRPLGTG
jgi:ubiquinol oxidase